MSNKPQMLQGYRVLDFTHFVAGPTCTRIMAEMGADVIKIERAPSGDRVRGLGLVKGGQSTYYVQHNHSKRSLGLDLQKPRARELLLKMIPKIDVVVENFAPGVIKEFGFAYEALKAINPKIVMCSVSAVGQTGPLAYKPGYDYIGQAYAGVTDLIGEPDRPPAAMTIAIGDVSTGVAAAMAVGFALLNRERTGEGTFIDASLLDTYFHMHELSVPVISMRPGRWSPKRSGAMHQTSAPQGIFKANGGFIYLAVLPNEWPRLLRAIKKTELAEDERFKTDRARLKNNQALREIIETWMQSFASVEAVLKPLDNERVPCAPVLTVAESMNHAHMRERGTVRRVTDSTMGEFEIPGMPVKFSSWPDRTDLKASLLGADNEAVLKETLGSSDLEIAQLYADKILIRDPTLDAPSLSAKKGVVQV
jgi:CoA:oxalate CoA-transferase